ncbi:MAG TPA: kelch repeat-containing protein [Candidatus Acidoferrum sp.]
MSKIASKTFFVAYLLIVSLVATACSGVKGGTTGGSGGTGGSGSGGSGGSGSGGSAGTGGSGGSTGPFTIGGTVVGLTGTGLVLEDNGGDDLTVTKSGAFVFKTAIAGSTTYNVTVKTQPTGPSQNCSVTNGSATATANVTNVQVTCGNIFTVGGSTSGLLGTGLVLQDNGADNLTINGTGNVNFTFATPIPAGAAYAVTILTQPSNPAQTCTVLNGTGTLNTSITNVQVICPQPAFTIGGSVVGLVPGAGNTVELQDNAGDDLFVTGNTSFTFPTSVTNGGIYNVSVFLQPTSQPQPCSVFNYTGIATANVSNVLVDCQHNDWNWMSWYIGGTNKSNNYATADNPIPPKDFNTPGGRDFAMTWNGSSGRKWLFGGFGFPEPSQNGAQVPGFLNDLWFWDPVCPVVPGPCWTPVNAGPGGNNTWPNLEVEDMNGIYGTLGTASPLVNTPGSRWGGVSWTDATGNLWMFGGQGFAATGLDAELLNDVWEFVPGTSLNPDGTWPGNWIWRGGSSSFNQSGAYGTQGTAAATNLPGGRWAAANFVDNAGNVWLFGGQGVDSAGTIGLLNDLWEYNIVSGQWTWISGANTANQNGVYGTQGTAAAGNVPGGRQAGVLWVDASGDVWLFGGFGLDSAGTGTPQGAILNDLWEFKGGQWVWVSGGNTANQNGVFGTQTLAAAGNVPGSRWGAVGWTDGSNNLWIFGGWGYGSKITQPTGFLNDVWEYQQSSGQWIWWKGTSNVNQSGAYLTNGIPFVNNLAGGRRGTAIWQPDAYHYVWMFGGEGYDSTAGAAPGYMNDLWTYLPFP